MAASLGFNPHSNGVMEDLEREKERGGERERDGDADGGHCMTEGKTDREVAEECGLLGEQRRERTTTKGRNKQEGRGEE